MRSLGTEHRRAAVLRASWLLAALCAVATNVVQATTFNVNSTADVPDAAPGDGICETATGNGVCTLRGAIQEANVHAGLDTIHLQAGATYLITRVGIEQQSLTGSLDILDSVDLSGAGPGSTIIDGNGGVTGDSVIIINKCIAADAGCQFGQVYANITGVTIRHGHPANIGGGIRSGAHLTLTNCAIEDNASDYSGGGLFVNNEVTLDHTVVSGNMAAGSGGGIFLFFNGPLHIVDSTIRDNVAGMSGGGLQADAGTSARIIGSTFSGNRAQQGGGIEVDASVATILDSTISGNSSNDQGGGLYCTGTANLFNVTIAGNTANADKTAGSGGNGGGVYVASGHTLNFANTIIANNSHLTDTLFSVLDDCGGTITSQGNNIVTHPTCTVAGSAVSTAVPLLGALQNNGGPTQTNALLAGSPAIDAGNPGGCADDLGAPITTDQRGRPRHVGAACDIGAYEVEPDAIFADGFGDLPN